VESGKYFYKLFRGFLGARLPDVVHAALSTKVVISYADSSHWGSAFTDVCLFFCTIYQNI